MIDGVDKCRDQISVTYIDISNGIVASGGNEYLFVTCLGFVQEL